MENKKNTAIFKNDETNHNRFKKLPDVVTFRCRLNEEDCKLWENIFGKTPVKKTERDRCNVDHNRFTQLEYDNSTAKDMIMYHGNVMVKETLIDEVKELIKSNFTNVEFKRKGKSMTTTINDRPPLSGIWKTKELPPKKLKTIDPAFPIGIVSYQRANQYGRTHILLTRMKVKHYLFVESQEESQYRDWYDPTYCELVVADNFSELDMGSTPMRNYVLDYFDEDYVWILDDNIMKYTYFNRGKQNPIESPVIFTMVENYVLGCDNVGIASHNFGVFVPEGMERTCVIKNGKCYSSMLLNNRIGLRFSHKHQEDNFISIDSICKGYNTLCFNSMLYVKKTSGEDKGGNHDGIYKCGNKKDGKGYKERYDYFVTTARQLIESGDIVLKDDKDPDSFIWRDHTMKSKEYHAKAHYSFLQNSDNELIFNDNTRRCFNNYIEFIPN
jgi:hypothetical protein